MGKQFLNTAHTGKPCSAVWGTVICGFEAGPPHLLKTQKICLSSCFTSMALKFWEILGGLSTPCSLCLHLFPWFLLLPLQRCHCDEALDRFLGDSQPVADGLLRSLLHAPVVSAVQSAGLTGSINQSWKERCSESSGPIWDVLMGHRLKYTTCT